MRRLLLSILCLLVLVAGCAGGDDDEAADTTSATTEPATTSAGGATTSEGVLSQGTPNPVMGETLLRFVKAAGRGDAGGMWAELDIATRASIGPTLSDFSTGNANGFNQGLGTLADSARVVLSRQIGDTFGVAAIVGTRTVQGEKEEFAYGAALLNEDDRWKLELGGIVITGLVPEPLAKTSDRTPRIAGNVGAAGDFTELHMWLDGKPLRVRNEGQTPFTAKLSAQPPESLKPGHHVAITFAATDETATATAWPFTVE
jgi:hypothetical protein